MPLSRGTTSEAVSRNIVELIHSYRRKGKIGNITPRNAEHAQKVAEAIAMREKRESQHARSK